MKRLLVILLVVSMMLMLCACIQSAAAKNVDEQILAIGTVTLDSKAAIDDALNSYTALTEKEKTTIKNLDILKEAQVSYIELLVESLKNIKLEERNTLLQAREYYESLSAEQKEMTDCQLQLSEIENDFAALENFEELKRLIKLKGIAETEGGVNNSSEIEQWTCGNLELSKWGDVTYIADIDIEGSEAFTIGRTYYVPTTRIYISIYKDHFDISFSSEMDAIAILSDIDLAEGKMYNVMYKNYSIDGKLPDITEYHSNTISMLQYDAPFDSDIEYGEYIRGCIHDQICDVLTILENQIGYDITKLGFSEAVVQGID